MLWVAISQVGITLVNVCFLGCQFHAAIVFLRGGFLLVIVGVFCLRPTLVAPSRAWPVLHQPLRVGMGYVWCVLHCFVYLVFVGLCWLQHWISTGRISE